MNLLRKQCNIPSKKVYVAYQDAVILISLGNFKAAKKQLEELAEDGFSPAQFDLGWLYYNGKGVKRDLDKAVEWWVAAMKSGYKDAELMLKAVKKYKDFK